MCHLGAIVFSISRPKGGHFFASLSHGSKEGLLFFGGGGSFFEGRGVLVTAVLCREDLVCTLDCCDTTKPQYTGKHLWQHLHI